MPILDNPRHEKYAQELAKGASQSDAYVAAGYARNDSHASRLARNGKVAARVEELQAAGAERAEIDIARVLAELAKIGFANMLDYVQIVDGSPLVDLSSVTREQAAAIAQVVVEDFKDGRGDDARDVRKVTFKLHDKRAALVDIGNHLGMFKSKVEVTGKDGKDLVPIVTINGSAAGPG